MYAASVASLEARMERNARLPNLLGQLFWLLLFAPLLPQFAERLELSSPVALAPSQLIYFPWVAALLYLCGFLLIGSQPLFQGHLFCLTITTATIPVIMVKNVILGTDMLLTTAFLQIKRIWTEEERIELAQSLGARTDLPPSLLTEIGISSKDRAEITLKIAEALYRATHPTL